MARSAAPERELSPSPPSVSTPVGPKRPAGRTAGDSPRPPALPARVPVNVLFVLESNAAYLLSRWITVGHAGNPGDTGRSRPVAVMLNAFRFVKSFHRIRRTSLHETKSIRNTGLASLTSLSGSGGRAARAITVVMTADGAGGEAFPGEASEGLRCR